MAQQTNLLRWFTKKSSAPSQPSPSPIHSAARISNSVTSCTPNHVTIKTAVVVEGTVPPSEAEQLSPQRADGDSDDEVYDYEATRLRNIQQNQE